jgi:methylmalonyl-CoA/ethylmalonyl-CoA epimerase
MNNGWTIDHVAIVVADLEATIAFYTKTLGFAQLYRETIVDQGVEAVGIQTGESVIELLRPLDETSPIAAFRGTAPTKMHHIAYRVADIKAELARLRADGVRLIDEKPRKGASIRRAPAASSRNSASAPKRRRASARSHLWGAALASCHP